MSKAGAMSGSPRPRSRIWRPGRQQQSAEDIATLLEVYGADRWTVARLTDLAGRADEANWWNALVGGDPTVADDLRRAGADRRARVSLPRGTHVPRAAYRRGICGGPHRRGDAGACRSRAAGGGLPDRPGRSADDPDRPLRLHAVFSSAALDAEVGTAEVREAQLIHLAKMADLPAVTIQVLRPEDAVRAGYFASGFVLLGFDAVCHAATSNCSTTRFTSTIGTVFARTARVQRICSGSRWTRSGPSN